MRPAAGIILSIHLLDERNEPESPAAAGAGQDVEAERPLSVRCRRSVATGGRSTYRHTRSSRSRCPAGTRDAEIRDTDAGIRDTVSLTGWLPGGGA
jgi:hypothetical protein